MRARFLLMSVVVASMVMPAIVTAQDRPDRGNGGQGQPGGRGRPGGGQGGGGQPGRPGGGNPGGGQPGRPGGGRPDHGGPQIQPGRPGGGFPGGGGQPGRPGGGRPDHGGPQIQPIRPGFGGQRPPHHGGGFHRPPSYRPQPYRYPRGYGYRRWQVGAILPSILFGSSFYFNDYAEFGLYSPPPRYRWVRYGPDLILVNTRNGHVRDVRYNVFG